ncbi:MAG: TraB/GumN family protein [Nanoarchaeota archaeon]|nr:TraB/GumN family protein [Nanoarchaeota archaeon]
MIHILGTSHIAKQSLKEVREYIEKEKPDIVALELDRSRLAALTEKRRTRLSLSMLPKFGLTGFIFALIGAWAEKKMGDIVGISPGEEMLLAAKLAKEHNLNVVCIDQHITITLKRLSKGITWKERFRFFWEIITGIFNPKRLPFDLRKVPEDKVIEKLVEHVKIHYPNVYRVLIEERNHHMASRLNHITKQHPKEKILAIVGAGHRKGIEELLNPTISYTFSVGPKTI